MKKAIDWFLLLMGNFRKSVAARMSEKSQKQLRTARARMRKSIRRLERLSEEMENAADRHRKRLSLSVEVGEKRLERLRKKAVLLSETTAEDLDEAERLMKLSETALEALRKEHKIYEKVTVPLLVSHIQKHTEKNNAEIAEQGRRQALASPPQNDRWE